MTDDIRESIKQLATQMRNPTKSEDALRYTQAALNLAHVLQVLHEVDNPPPPHSISISNA